MAWLGVIALVVVACGAVGFGLEAVLGLHRGASTVSGPGRVLGAAWACAGIGLALWTYVVHPPAVMARATSRTVEILVGRKGPRESGVPRLLTRGPYRLARNPLYLALFLGLSGAAFATGELGFLFMAILLVGFQRAVMVGSEERELRARFGAAYEAYCHDTARFVPLPRSLGARPVAVRIAILAIAVAAAVALGSIWGGDTGRIVSASHGGVGDDLVFAALAWGAVGALALGPAAGWIAAGRLALARPYGLLAGALAFGFLVSLYVGPWRIF